MTARMAASKSTASKTSTTASKPSVVTSGPRNLVLMFDGTWNDRHSLTNVARMYEAIDDYNPYRTKSGYDPAAEGNEQEEKAINEKAAIAMTEEAADKQSKVATAQDAAQAIADLPRVQLVKYLTGVGTDAVGKISGGVGGYGLSEKIKKGYLWLSNNYRSGDDIFVFGFSRGAYAARSLVSFVHRCNGVLNLKNGELDLKHVDSKTKDKVAPSLRHWPRDVFLSQGTAGKDVTDRLLDRMYESYAAIANPDEIPPTDIAAKFDLYKEYCQHVTIKMLGVWDTVGSVGLQYHLVPGFVGDHMPGSRAKYKFHESEELPCIVENAYHALAIDEMRADFRPSLWQKLGEDPDRKRATFLRRPDGTDVPGYQPVKQVWFVGSHCNVGGGAISTKKSQDQPGGQSQYSYAEEDRPDDLWQYSYVWMQNKAEDLGLRFFWKYHALGIKDDKSNVFGPIDGSHRRVSWTKPLDSLDEMAWGLYKHIPHTRQPRDIAGSKGIHTSLHWSVKERNAMDDEYRKEHTEMFKFMNVSLISETKEVGEDGEDIVSNEPPTGSDKHECSCGKTKKTEKAAGADKTSFSLK